MDGDASNSETLALLEGLFENSPVGFTYVDTELRYQRVNSSVAAINGGTIDERVGRTIDDVHGEPCGPQFSAVCREVIRTGKPQRVRIEGRLWHGTGPYQVWRMNYYPVFGAAGEVIGVGDVFVDITDSERTATELAELSAARDYELTRYQSLVDATSAAVWTRDAQGQVVEDSPTYRAITGQTVNRYLAGGHLAAVHPDDRAGTELSWRAAVAAGKPYQHVNRLLTATGEYRHFRVRAVPVVVGGRGAEQRVVEWIGTETDIEAEVRARTRLELLARATAAVDRELDTDRELQALAEVLVPAFADACTVHLIDPIVAGGPITGRRLVQRGSLGVLGVPAAEAFRLPADHPFAQLCRTGRPMLLGHPPTDGPATLLAPIRSGGAVVAAFSLVARGDRPRYSDEDLVFVSELAGRVSTAVEHAQRFQAARRASLTLQQAMLSDPPLRSDVTVEARYQPALDDLEVGGDWYDAFTLPGGDLGLVVGDVVGHDLEAAAVMGQLRSMFRGIAMVETLAPSAAVARLDELAIALRITGFTTLLYGRLRTGVAGAVFTWCSAGHVPPILLPDGGGHLLLEGGSGLVLGVDATTPRSDATALLPRGSTLLLCTDGLVEQRLAHFDDGMVRLGALAEKLVARPLAGFCDGVLAGSPSDTGDDVVILAARLPE